MLRRQGSVDEFPTTYWTRNPNLIIIAEKYIAVHFHNPPKSHLSSATAPGDAAHTTR